MALGTPTPIVAQSAAEGVEIVWDAVSATNGFKFTWTVGQSIHIKTGATPVNMTVEIGKKVLGNSVSPKVFAIGANKEFVYGPLHKDHRREVDETDANKVYIHFDAEADVDCAVLLENSG